MPRPCHELLVARSPGREIFNVEGAASGAVMAEPQRDEQIASRDYVLVSGAVSTTKIDQGTEPITGQRTVWTGE